MFTPKGEILRLPSGSTVVDFAYAVHTDIGNRCVAAKVDRRLSPLRTVLRDGAVPPAHDVLALAGWAIGGLAAAAALFRWE